MGSEETKGEMENKARLAIMELANMMSVPMSLNAVIRLNVADAIWRGGANTPVSAAEILRHVLPSGDPENLQRILRMLTSYGVFVEHLDHSGSERRYSLTEIGKSLVPDENGLSSGAYILQHHQDELMKAWPMVHETVVDPTTDPFMKANGQPAYQYYGKNPEMKDLMKKAMSGLSVPVMKAILDGYNGFEGAERVVDVGGSAGDCLGMILDKFPNVKEGINFDLPEVVEKAPAIPRVRHMGGDMFNYIPAADVIFMKGPNRNPDETMGTISVTKAKLCMGKNIFGCIVKWILTWTDDECRLIMNNCYKVLPVGGKLIACEPVLPDHSDNSQRTRALLEADIFIMTMYRAKGKQRTEDEFRRLGESVGFVRFRAVYIDYFHTVLEFVK